MAEVIISVTDVPQDVMHKELTTKNQLKCIKSQGLAKLDFTCPSTLQLTESGGNFKAVLYLPHIGHTCTLQHINLSKNDRIQIAGKIAQGISFEKILDDVRDGINSEETLNRIHLLDRPDLRNITNEFSLLSDVKLHKNDSQSVDIWVKMMKDLGDESPVQFYIINRKRLMMN